MGRREKKELREKEKCMKCIKNMEKNIYKYKECFVIKIVLRVFCGFNKNQVRFVFFISFFELFSILSRGKFGNSLGTFRDGMLGKFTRKNQSNSRLDFTGWDSWSLGISSKLSSFNKGSIKDVSNKGVQDGHGFLGDSLFRVDLL